MERPGYDTKEEAGEEDREKEEEEEDDIAFLISWVLRLFPVSNLYFFFKNERD